MSALPLLIDLTPLRAITDFDAHLFTEAMRTRSVAMNGFTRKEFMPGKLKPEYESGQRATRNIQAKKKFSFYMR